MRTIILLLLVGCGSVSTLPQVDAGDAAGEGPAGDAHTEADQPPPDAASEEGNGQKDASADVTQACSWTCLSFCYCGALPCCRASGAGDCCTR